MRIVFPTFIDITQQEKMSEKVSEKVSEKMSEKVSEKILKLINKDPYITIAQLSDNIGTTTRTIERNIKNLKDAKRLKRIGADKGGYWEVMK